MRLVLSVFLIVLGVAFFMLTEWYPEALWLQGTLMKFIYPVTIILVGLLLVACSIWVLPRDPDLFSWGILGFAGCLLVIPLLVAKDHQVGIDLQAQAEVEEQRKQLRQELRRQQQVKKAVEADRRERMKDDRFVQYEGRIPMDTLNALRLLDNIMHEAVEERSREYMNALNSTPTKGPSTWILSRAPEELDAQISAHKFLYEETRAFTQFIESFEASYTAEIDKLQLEPPADRIAVAELERILQAWERTHVYTLRQLDVGILGEALKALNVLREEWGNWSFDPRTNDLSFMNPEQELTFHRSILRMKEIQKELENID